MGYYNRTGTKLNIRENNFIYLGSGYQAEVFRDGTKAIKKYYKNTDSGRISLSVFDYLKDISNPHLIQFEDVFWERNSFPLAQAKSDLSYFDGYISKYYQEEPINVLLAPTDYLLDNVRELDCLMERFANDGIQARDLSRSNAILSSDGIVLIDPDEFCEGKDKIANAYDNKRRLVGLLKDVCRFSVLPQFGITLKEVSNLMNVETHYDTDIAYQLSKKLGASSRPIDYFLHR